MKRKLYLSIRPRLVIRQELPKGGDKRKAKINWSLIVTVCAIIIGLLQFYLSQQAIDIRRFEQTYFTERLEMFKEISASSSMILVSIQFKDSVKNAYRDFKSAYWKIQLLVDDTKLDTIVLRSLHRVDSLVSRKVKSQHPDGGRVEAINTEINKLNKQLNDLIIYERDKIQTVSVLDWFLLLFGKGPAE